MSNRVGIYAWAGPGTVRLLETKYWDPQIDRESFLMAYDLPYLTALKEKFGVTDAWVTYSWGFSDGTEQEDYEFLRQRRDNFARLGIKTHAYVQGFNLVTDEWTDIDPWCRDPWGRRIPYSKDRAFTCPNNPHAVQIITDRVLKASRENISGIYIDNILFGMPPFTVTADYLPWFGCSCVFCQKAFSKQFGYPLPIYEKKDHQIHDYLLFRSDSIARVLKTVSSIARRAGKEFGINLYDPSLRLDTLYYGYSLAEVSPYLDYFLIENHSLPRGEKNNEHLLPLLKRAKKPVFVTSYKNGIGYEFQFSQRDIDSIYTESSAFGYSPCFKVTEFTTAGTWHMLRLDTLSTPKKIAIAKMTDGWNQQAEKSNWMARWCIRWCTKTIITLIGLSQTNRILSALVSGSHFYREQVKKPRYTSFTPDS